MTRKTLLSALLVLFLAAAVLPGQPGHVAKLAYLEGPVMVLRYGSKVPERAELGMTLFRGDQIKTFTGKCQINVTSGGILRLSPNTTMMFSTKDEEDVIKLSVMVKYAEKQWVRNLRQVLQLDPEEPWHVRLPVREGDEIPPSPELVARLAREDLERLIEPRPSAPGSAGSSEEQIVAEYRALLPAVMQKEKKPWHTRFEFIANAVRMPSGYRVAYRTYCLIETGPDKGKDHPCYEFDSVLDLATLRQAVADMKRRLKP